MRIRDFYAAAMVLAAVPAFAQAPKDVTGPWTLTPAMVTCTDLPITAIPTPRLVVKGPQANDDRFAIATGEVLVIGRSPNDGLAVGQRFVASRIDRDAKYFPRPGEGFGALHVTGFITITAINEWNALANIDLACDAVQIGDYLDPFVETELPMTAAESLDPDFDDRGQILFAIDTRSVVGQGDVVSIDRGSARGVTVGARFAVYRDKHSNGLPLIYLGEVVVLSTSELTSKAMVTRAVDAIYQGDTIVPRTVKPQQ